MFAWSDFLPLAQELATRADEEAAARTAISRAYYAALGSARDHFLDQGIVVPKAGPAHRLVWDHFHANQNTTHRRIANLGRQ